MRYIKRDDRREKAAPEKKPAREEYDAALKELLDQYQSHQTAQLYHAQEASKALRAVLEIMAGFDDSTPEELLHVVKRVTI